MDSKYLKNQQELFPLVIERRRKEYKKIILNKLISFCFKFIFRWVFGSFCWYICLSGVFWIVSLFLTHSSFMFIMHPFSYQTLMLSGGVAFIECVLKVITKKELSFDN